VVRRRRIKGATESIDINVGGKSTNKKEDLENQWSARMNCIQVFKL
jgi:hypothetical protein